MTKIKIQTQFMLPKSLLLEIFKANTEYERFIKAFKAERKLKPIDFFHMTEVEYWVSAAFSWKGGENWEELDAEWLTILEQPYWETLEYFENTVAKWKKKMMKRVIKGSR